MAMIFFVVGRFSAPLAFGVKVVILACSHGQEDFVSKSVSQLAIKVVLMLPADILFEVVAGNNLVWVEEDADGVIDGGAACKKL